MMMVRAARVGIPPRFSTVPVALDQSSNSIEGVYEQNVSIAKAAYRRILQRLDEATNLKK